MLRLVCATLVDFVPKEGEVKSVGEGSRGQRGMQGLRGKSRAHSTCSGTFARRNHLPPHGLPVLGRLLVLFVGQEGQGGMEWSGVIAGGRKRHEQRHK